MTFNLDDKIDIDANNEIMWLYQINSTAPVAMKVKQKIMIMIIIDMMMKQIETLNWNLSFQIELHIIRYTCKHNLDDICDQHVQQQIFIQLQSNTRKIFVAIAIVLYSESCELHHPMQYRSKVKIAE